MYHQYFHVSFCFSFGKKTSFSTRIFSSSPQSALQLLRLVRQNLVLIRSIPTSRALTARRRLMNRSLFLPTGKTPLLRHRPPSSLSLVHDDPVRIPPVCSNARGALYTRYTPNDWWDFHHHQVASAQRMLLRSRTLNRDNDCLVRDIDVRTRRNQEISTKELAK